ncbi:Uncharacterised protein [Citrobacter amalonaticus]|nr:hypothetical protein CIAM_45060 [Citrobacter amalonaticus]STA62915.1 Uncharacterised protein [Citrobacter amalonaticus]
MVATLACPIASFTVIRISLFYSTARGKFVSQVMQGTFNNACRYLPYLQDMILSLIFKEVIRQSK